MGFEEILDFEGEMDFEQEIDFEQERMFEEQMTFEQQLGQAQELEDLLDPQLSLQQPHQQEQPKVHLITSHGEGVQGQHCSGRPDGLGIWEGTMPQGTKSKEGDQFVWPPSEDDQDVGEVDLDSTEDYAPGPSTRKTGRRGQGRQLHVAIPQRLIRMLLFIRRNQ